jgi:zinc protease
MGAGLAARPVEAQSVGPIASEHYTLPNGLDVVLARDPSTQVAAVDVWYFAGSREEPLDKAGLARLFEHLMFAGSTQVPAGRHARLIADFGGRLLANVDEDAARFGESVPSNSLPLALWLEADRMRGLTINDTTVGRARFDLLDDLGQRVSADPYTAAIVDAVASLWDSTSCPGYAHPAIGRAASIATLSTADAREFFRLRYVPNNARLVVSGDFDPVAVRQLVSSYFGKIPRGERVRNPACQVTYHPGAATRTFAAPAGGRAGLGVFYRLPAHDHADTPALELLGVLLSQGNGSRLATAVVRDARAALTTQGGLLGDHRGPQVFGLFAIATPGVTPDSLAALLAAQVTWVVDGQAGEAEVARARTIYRATAVSARERPGDIADLLQHAATFHESPDDINAEVDRVMRVTPEDIRRAATTWLTPDNAVTLVLTADSTS